MTKETRIRQRVSYKRWTRLVKALQEGSQADVLNAVDSMLNDMSAYRYNQTAGWSRESLDLAMEDWGIM